VSIFKVGSLKTTQPSKVLEITCYLTVANFFFFCYLSYLSLFGEFPLVYIKCMRLKLPAHFPTLGDFGNLGLAVHKVGLSMRACNPYQ